MKNVDKMGVEIRHPCPLEHVGRVMECTGGDKLRGLFSTSRRRCYAKRAQTTRRFLVVSDSVFHVFSAENVFWTTVITFRSPAEEFVRYTKRDPRVFFVILTYGESDTVVRNRAVHELLDKRTKRGGRDFLREKTTEPKIKALVSFYSIVPFRDRINFYFPSKPSCRRTLSSHPRGHVVYIVRTVAVLYLVVWSVLYK